MNAIEQFLSLSLFYCFSLSRLLFIFSFVTSRISFIFSDTTEREREVEEEKGRRKRADNWHFTHIFLSLSLFFLLHPMRLAIWLVKKYHKMIGSLNFIEKKTNGSIWWWEKKRKRFLLFFNFRFLATFDHVRKRRISLSLCRYVHISRSLLKYRLIDQLINSCSSPLSTVVFSSLHMFMICKSEKSTLYLAVLFFLLLFKWKSFSHHVLYTQYLLSIEIGLTLWRWSSYSIDNNNRSIDWTVLRQMCNGLLINRFQHLHICSFPLFD